MRRPAALYDIRHLLTAQLPHLSVRLRAVLALWVEGTLLGLNGCQDTVTMALAHGLRGPRNPHTLRRLQRELLYDDADRIDSWGPDQELEVERCFAPLLQWVRSGWVPTGGRELAQEPRVLAVDPTSKQDDLVALVISVVYRQHAIPVAWHIVGAQTQESWIDHFCRLQRLLALWVQGTRLGLNGCQDAVTLALAQGLTGPRNPHTLRRRQRELLYDDADRIGSWGPDQELEVERCFAPLLQWVRSWWVPTGGRELAQEPLLLAVDPTSKQDDLVALVISVVYRQHAIPVAWHIVGAQAKEPWIDHFCRLLRQLASAVPATVLVHVPCDQGLGSRDLWAQIVALGWHPCLRYPPHVTFQPEGQTSRVPVRSLITGPGGLWVGTGQAFRTQPLDATLIVLHAYGQRQPWVLLTHTPVAQTEPTLYACRNWIEQGFRGLKTVGWKWHKTRRLEPTRVGRHWLVLAIATLLAVPYGTRHEEAEARHREPGALGRACVGPPPS